MMKINFRYLAYVLIIVFPFISSCRPDPPVVPNQCSGCIQYHVSEVKNWLYFQPGTYWIYEEATSGAIDSVYVTSAYDDGNSQSAFFRCKTYSSYYTYYFNYMSDNSGLCENTFWGEKRCVLVRRDKTKPGDFVGETYAFFYRPIVGNTYDTWNSPSLSRVSVYSTLDSIEVNGSTYNGVVVMEEERNITELDQHTRIYFSEHTGIIKKELLDSNQVWNLIRYNIVQ